jgi:mannose-6-phosphate isomerase-like protein (cupin superfamily)
MRLLVSVLAAVTMFSTAAFAQNAMMKTFAAGADIPALIAKAKADRKGDAPLVIEPIASLAPYNVSLEYRPGTSPAAVHEKDAELMYVLEGSGSIVTGGKLVDEKRTNAANLNGPSITGGKSQAVAKGDLLIVPENTPHQVIPGGGAPIVLMTLHVPHPAPANWP